MESSFGMASQEPAMSMSAHEAAEAAELEVVAPMVEPSQPAGALLTRVLLLLASETANFAQAVMKMKRVATATGVLEVTEVVEVVRARLARRASRVALRGVPQERDPFEGRLMLQPSARSAGRVKL